MKRWVVGAAALLAGCSPYPSKPVVLQGVRVSHCDEDSIVVQAPDGFRKIRYAAPEPWMPCEVYGRYDRWDLHLIESDYGRRTARNEYLFPGDHFYMLERAVPLGVEKELPGSNQMELHWFDSGGPAKPIEKGNH